MCNFKARRLLSAFLTVIMLVTMMPLATFAAKQQSSASVTPKTMKAIYVLPGYLGSELYDSSGKKLWWPDNPLDLLNQNNLKKFYQDEYGNGTQLHVEYDKDDAGVWNPMLWGDTYAILMKKLKEKFEPEYDVKFFPFNWIEDLNDSEKNLEASINSNGYTDVVFITHSTGGLLASAYISKSDENKRKVEKAILIAAPLFGTYSALNPIERGDSGKVIKSWCGIIPTSFDVSTFIINALTSNTWVRAWAKNSPTTYQLLPSAEYLQYLPLQEKTGLFQTTKTITSINDFYGVLNKSNNINSRLTNGSNRSHKYFRETVLGGDVVEQWSLASLMEVDALLIGTASGYDTPSVAVYSEPFLRKDRQLKDIQYNKNGDGTVQGFSAKGQKKTQSKPSLRTDFSFTASHGDLVTNTDVINRVCSEIAGSTYSSAVGLFSAAFKVLAVDPGMSDRIKIHFTADKVVKATIYNTSNEIIAEAESYAYMGFDDGGLIYDNFADDENSTEANIYMPNQGYKLVFSYGDTAGESVDFKAEASTLAADGWKEVTVNHTADITVEDGVISVIDGLTQAITNENISSKIDGDVTINYTDWELPASTEINLNDTEQIVPTGTDAEQVAASLQWDTSDDSVAKVSDDGTIIPQGYGIATISATDGNKFAATEVLIALRAESVVLGDIEMLVDERKLIKPEFVPAASTEIDMTYTLSEEGIVEVNELGVLHALKAGTATVTGTTAYGVKNTFKVSVLEDAVSDGAGEQTAPPSSGASVGTGAGNGVLPISSALTPSQAAVSTSADAITSEAALGTASDPAFIAGTTAANPFADVKSDDWCYDAVQFVSQKGITQGVSATLYDPQGNVTRAQFITMLCRAYGIKERDGDNFSDAGSAWYTGYLAAAKQLGISNGIGDNVFQPDAEITREQMLTLIYNYVNSTGEGAVGAWAINLPYADKDRISDWALEGVMFGTIKQWVKGKDDGGLDPSGTATRAELAQIFYNIFSAE
ncbi:MAG: S-layer homology domain-containing protein [Clostridiales Family XIII bacterium]|nr:S-layer homology domain-containing protein [Clostridiales Family XIII bacterium]